MQVHKNEKTTYLYINGIEVIRSIKIGEQIELQPAEPAYNKAVLNSFSDRAKPRVTS